MRHVSIFGRICNPNKFNISEVGIVFINPIFSKLFGNQGFRIIYLLCLYRPFLLFFLQLHEIQTVYDYSHTKCEIILFYNGFKIIVLVFKITNVELIIWDYIGCITLIIFEKSIESILQMHFLFFSFITKIDKSFIHPR